MEEIKNIQNERYNLKGDIFFDTKDKQFKISQQEVLNLVYTLYDSLGLPYTEPDKLSDIMEGGE